MTNFYPLDVFYGNYYVFCGESLPAAYSICIHLSFTLFIVICPYF